MRDYAYKERQRLIRETRDNPLDREYRGLLKDGAIQILVCCSIVAVLSLIFWQLIIRG